MQTIRWGIAGPGKIAAKFATGLASAESAELVAVGSRSRERAASFATEHGAARVHEGYDALFADPEVDAIYIATPHTGHRDLAVAALAAGKAVLCEKPMAVNQAQVRSIVTAARQHGVFCMEAMWTRFIPIMARVRAWLDAGAIGELRMVRADFGFRAPWDPDSRLLDPALAGGGLLDVGIYPLAFACWAFAGQPETLVAQGHLGRTGVDEQAAMLVRFAGGGLGILDCGVRTQTTHGAVLHGTDGQISIDPPFWRSMRATLRAGDHEDVAEEPFHANGYEYEAMEVGRCLRAGLLESPGMPLDESLAIAGLLDEARRQIGVVYPCEED